MDNNAREIVSNLHPRFSKSILFAKEQVSLSVLSKHLCYVILYGSCAKQTAKFDSDVDILLVVSDEAASDRSLVREFRKLRSTLLDYEEGADIDVRIISLSSWEANDTIYLKSIHREGIFL